jgi:hypothetical protein
VEIVTRVTIVDVDLVFSCGVEEVIVDGEGGYWARRMWCERGETCIRDLEVVEILWRESEFLERWN